MDLKKLFKHFQESKNSSKSNKKWVNGVVGGPPSAANRALQARAAGVGNVTRISSELQAEFESWKEFGLYRLSFLRPGTEEENRRQLETMIQHLRDSEVTINFNAADWFRNPCLYTSYKQMFEKNQGNYEGWTVDMAAATQSGMPHDRARAEERKLFTPTQPLRRGAGNLVRNAPQRFGRSGALAPPNKPTEVRGTQRLYRPQNLLFVGASRPRYAALNFTDCPNGAVEANGNMYGHSVLVWKDVVKKSATYCAGDSFNADVRAETICTYDTLGAMLGWANQQLFEDLARVALDGDTKVPTRDKLFFECHIYQPLEFRTLLVRLDLSAREVFSSRNPAMYQNAVDFCRRNGVLLCQVP